MNEKQEELLQMLAELGVLIGPTVHWHDFDEEGLFSSWMITT